MWRETVLVAALMLGLFVTANGEATRVAQSVLPVDLAVSFVPPAAATARGRALVYELQLTSFRAVELELRRIDVFSPDSPEDILHSLTGAGLVDAIARPGKPAELEKPATLLGGDFAIVFLWVELDGRPAPEILAHRATFNRVKADGSETEYTVEGAVVRVPTSGPLVLDAPLPAGRWLMANGPSVFGEHRLFIHALDGAASNTQRFASDWMLLGEDGRLFHGDAGSNESWCTYDVPVLAVADAVVIDVRDGVPENEPLAEELAVRMTREAICGNYVVLELPDGTFAFYGHLRPGSLLVSAGDRVTVGQALGAIGNSGNSDAPHLHFHVSNSPYPLSGEGLPFALRSFAVLDTFPDVASWEPLLDPGAPWEGTADATSRTLEMPVGEAIIGIE